MSTTEIKATKWAAQHTAGHDTHGQTAIYDEATGKDVAIVYDGDAHAELIVRAVNSHADMLEALELAQAQLVAAYRALNHNDAAWNGIFEAANRIGDAIAKARGVA